LIKAVAKSSGRSDKYIRDNANQTGDLGKVAATSKATQSTMEKFMKKTKAAPITVLEILLNNLLIGIVETSDGNI